MRKPSRIIFMALRKTYGMKSNQYLFMCNAIRHLENITCEEIDGAISAVNAEIKRLGSEGDTMVCALNGAGLLPSKDAAMHGSVGAMNFKVLRRYYIKLVIKLFFKGL